MWRGPTEGRVRVISPYRARARRVAHMFVCSMQDGDFPRRDTGGPLLSDDCSPRSGSAGAKEGRSRGPIPLHGLPLAAEAAALALLAERRRRGRRNLAVAVRRRGPRAARASAAAGSRGTRRGDRRGGGRPRPRGVRCSGSPPAPSERELARSRGGGRTEDGERPPPARPAGARAGAQRGCARSRLFRALHSRGIRTLPLSLVHRPRAPPAADWAQEEPLTSGSIAHKVLESLYEEPPGPSRGRPADSLDAWRPRAAS